MERVEVVAGIDVGITGGWALLNRDGSAWKVGRIPVKAFPPGASRTVKRRIDARGLYDVLAAGRIVSAFVEDPGVVSRGRLAASSLHNSFGAVLSVLDLLGCPVRLIRANGQKGWKRVYGLESLGRLKDSEKKARSVHVAESLIGGFEISRKQDHGVAEAALIARFGIKYMPDIIQWER